MKWPQFELWRLFAAMTLCGVGFWCFTEAFAFRDPHSPVLIAPAVAFIGAAIGMLFRCTFRGAVIPIASSALIVAFAILIYGIIWH